MARNYRIPRCGPLGQEVGKNLTESQLQHKDLFLSLTSQFFAYHWSPDIFINMKTMNTRVIKLFRLNVCHFNSRARSAQTQLRRADTRTYAGSYYN